MLTLILFFRVMFISLPPRHILFTSLQFSRSQNHFKNWHHIIYLPIFLYQSNWKALQITICSSAPPASNFSRSLTWTSSDHFFVYLLYNLTEALIWSWCDASQTRKVSQDKIPLLLPQWTDTKLLGFWGWGRRVVMFCYGLNPSESPEAS